MPTHASAGTPNTAVMMRNSYMLWNRRALAGVLVSFSVIALVLAGPLYPAPALADEPTQVGPVASATLDHYGPKGITGWGCNVAMYWTTAPNAENFIRANYSCGTGKIQDGVILRMFVDPEPAPGDGTNCPRLYVFTNTDVDETDQSSGSFGPGSAGTGCGAVTEVCTEQYGNGTWATLRCANIDLGVPPGASPPAEVGSCPRATLLRPYASTPYTDGTSGSWRWRVDLYFRVAGRNPLGSLVIGGVNARLKGWAKTSSGLRIRTGGVTPAQRSGSAGGDSSHAVSFDHNTGLVSTPSVTDIKVQLESSTIQSGAVGSTGAPIVFSAGYLSDGLDTVNASVSYGLNTETAIPSESNWASGSASANNFAGHTHLPWCYAGWGDLEAGPTGLGSPRGEIGSVTGSGTPPVYVPPNTTPPVIEVDPDGSGCTTDPAPEYCVAPPPSGAPPSVPDPESEGCDFSITNPSTWGGQIICALAALAGAIIDAVMGVLDFLGGLIAGLLDLLMSLFVPNPDSLSSSIDGLRDSFEGGPVGEWTGSFDGAFSGGSPGGCGGPQVDLSTLGVPGVEPMKPFDACTGATADAAGLVRTVATVSISIGAGLFIIRMLTAALGIAVPAPGRAGERQ